MKFTATQIAEYLGGTVVGNGDAAVGTFAKIEEGCEGAISFLANAKYEHYLYDTASSIVLINDDFEPSRPVGATLIRVPNAYEAIARLLTLYQQSKPKRTGVDARAFVADSATVGEGCYIAPFAYVGEGVRIGANTQIYAGSVIEEGSTVGEGCVIHPNVTIYADCHVGSRVILHAGCVVGADGFGFAPTAEGYEKIPQIGNVVIEDDVEVGANTCIDRSTMGSTVIKRGVKLDNLVQIAHNVEVGEHTVMSAQVGVAGSTKIGRRCMFGGQVGIVGHAVIGDNVMCGAQAGIAKGIPAGNVAIQGSPAIDARNFARSSAAFKRLPEMFAELNKLRKEFDEQKKK